MSWKNIGGDTYQKRKATGRYEEIKFLLPPALWDRFLDLCLKADLSPDEMIVGFIEEWLRKLEMTDEFNRLLRKRIEAQNTE